MNRKKLYAILAAESAFIIILCVLTVQVPDSFTSIWNFPFEQIGAGLLALHGLGSVGVGIACALWVGLSLLPVIPAVRGRGKTPWERVLLVLFAVCVCATLHFMTNPIKLMTPYDDTGSYSKLVFSITTWSILILYFVVRIVRLLREGDRDKLNGYFDTALYALAMLCAANIVAYGANTLAFISAAGMGGLDAFFRCCFCGKQAAVCIEYRDNRLYRRVHGRRVERRCGIPSAEGRAPCKAVLLDAYRDGGADGRLQCNAAYVFAIPFAHHDEPANTCFQHRVYAVCPAAYAHHR